MRRLGVKGRNRKPCIKRDTAKGGGITGEKTTEKLEESRRCRVKQKKGIYQSAMTLAKKQVRNHPISRGKERPVEKKRRENGETQKSMG